MLVDKQSQLMSDLLFTVHQHRGDDVTWKPPIKNPAWAIKKQRAERGKRAVHFRCFCIKRWNRQATAGNTNICFFFQWRWIFNVIIIFTRNSSGPCGLTGRVLSTEAACRSRAKFINFWLAPIPRLILQTYSVRLMPLSIFERRDQYTIGSMVFSLIRNEVDRWFICLKERLLGRWWT